MNTIYLSFLKRSPGDEKTLHNELKTVKFHRKNGTLTENILSSYVSLHSANHKQLRIAEYLHILDKTENLVQSTYTEGMGRIYN